MLHPRPRQAQPLPLPRAAPRPDGLHELCSLFEPLALADLIEVAEARARRGRSARASRARTWPRGRWPALRERGWERAAAADRDREADPGRGRARRRQRRRRRGPAPGRRRGRRPAEALAAGARRRRALAAASRRWPWSAAPASGSSRCPSRRRTPPSCCPAAAASAPPRSSPRPTGSASAARRRSSTSSRRGCARRPAPAPRRSPMPSCSSTTSSRRRARCGPTSATRSTRCATPARRVAHAERLRPDRLRPLRRPRRGRRPPPRRSTATTRSSARRAGAAPMKLPGARAAAATANALLIAIVAVGGRLRLLPAQPRARHLDLQKLLEDVSNTLGAWTYLLVGVFAFAETGAFVGLVVPGETVMLLGGAVAGQGAIDIYLLIAIAWFSAWAGDTTSFFIGRRLGREFVLAPRAALRDQPRALREGRGLLLPPRRQDDLHRPLHQPRPRLRAVHRRQLGHALPRLRPLQRPRHRALGQRPHPRRLLLLAQHRHRRRVRRQGRLPARRR